MEKYLLEELNKYCVNSKYYAWYIDICTNIKKTRPNRIEAKERYGYIETHHFIPKSFNKVLEKDSNNLIHCTAREHYILHKCLVYASKKHYQYKASLAMTGFLYRSNGRVEILSSRRYEYVKKSVSLCVKSRPHPKGMLGKKHTTETKTRISASSKELAKNREIPEIFKKGRQKSETHKNNIGQAHKKKLEYAGEIYFGYEDLKERGGISKHIYQKYYLNGIDPSPYLINPYYARIGKNRKGTVIDKRWWNDGKEEKYVGKAEESPEGWRLGRLPRNKDMKGRFIKQL